MNRVLMRAITGRYTSAEARCVLPTPLGPSKKMFSARSMNDRLASSWIRVFGAPLAKLKS